jgi:hypothetical protein
LESSRCPCPFTGSWFPEPDFIAAAETSVAIPRM